MVHSLHKMRQSCLGYVTGYDFDNPVLAMRSSASGFRPTPYNEALDPRRVGGASPNSLVAPGHDLSHEALILIESKWCRMTIEIRDPSLVIPLRIANSHEVWPSYPTRSHSLGRRSSGRGRRPLRESDQPNERLAMRLARDRRLLP
jgi:hypothetical protein